MMKTNSKGRWAIPVWLATAALTLSACGGGGTASLAQIQSDADGVWRGTATVNSATQNASAVVLPDGQAWVVFSNAAGPTALLQGDLAAKTQAPGYAGVAAHYDLTDGGAFKGNVDWSGSAQPKTQLEITPSNAATPLGQAVFTQWLDPNPTATLDVTGTWQDNTMTPQMSWAIDDKGDVVGTGGGCTYSGKVSVVPDASAVQSVDVTESCSGTDPTETQFNGIVTAGVEASHRQFTLISGASPARALLLSLVLKQP